MYNSVKAYVIIPLLLVFILSSCNTELNRSKAKKILIESLFSDNEHTWPLSYGELYLTYGTPIKAEEALARLGMIKFEYIKRVKCGGNMFTCNVYRLHLTPEGEKYKRGERRNNNGSSYMMKMADRAFLDITGLQEIDENTVKVEFDWTFKNLTPFGYAECLERGNDSYVYYEGQIFHSSIVLIKYDDGWRLENENVTLLNTVDDVDMQNVIVPAEEDYLTADNRIPKPKSTPKEKESTNDIKTELHYDPQKVTDQRIISKDKFFILNVAAKKTESDAIEMKDKLISDGYDADYLWIPDYASLSGAQFFSVYIGPFDSQKDCEIATENYRKKSPDAYGLMVSQDKIRVQINGIDKISITPKVSNIEIDGFDKTPQEFMMGAGCSYKSENYYILYEDVGGNAAMILDGSKVRLKWSSENEVYTGDGYIVRKEILTRKYSHEQQQDIGYLIITNANNETSSINIIGGCGA